LSKKEKLKEIKPRKIEVRTDYWIALGSFPFLDERHPGPKSGYH